MDFPNQKKKKKLSLEWCEFFPRICTGERLHALEKRREGGYLKGYGYDIKLTVIHSATALNAHCAAADDNAASHGLLCAVVVDGQGDGVHDALQADVHQVPGGLLQVAIGVEVGAQVVGAGAETGIGAIEFCWWSVWGYCT